MIQPLLVKLGQSYTDSLLGNVRECSLVLSRDEYPESPVNGQITIFGGVIYIYELRNGITDWYAIDASLDSCQFTDEYKLQIHTHENADVLSRFNDDGINLYYDSIPLSNSTPYIHPITHPASMIVPDPTHQFITQTQLDSITSLDILPNNTFFVQKRTDTYIPTGSLIKPFKTIQSALDNIPYPVTGSENIQHYTILIHSGFYDETLTIKAGIRVAIYSIGRVVLGNNITTPTTRNIIWESDSSKEISEFKPSLSLGSLTKGEFNFTVSGSINIQSFDGSQSSKDLYLDNVNIIDNIYAFQDSGTVNIYVNDSKINGYLQGPGITLKESYNGYFGNFVEVYSYGKIDQSEFIHGFSTFIKPLNGGFYDTVLRGEFRGPAGSLILDAETNHWFNLYGTLSTGSKTFIGRNERFLSDTTSIPVNSTQITIPFNASLLDTTYELSVLIRNDIDTDPSIYSYIVTDKSTTHFTLMFSGEIDSSNYVLEWMVSE